MGGREGSRISKNQLIKWLRKELIFFSWNCSIARKADEDDPLKWIEENIPESAENPLPVIDSDEEIETTKLEINKMQ